MSKQLEIELTDLEIARIEELAKVSGQSPNHLAASLVRSQLEERSDKIRRISERLLQEKAELYRRLAQ